MACSLLLASAKVTTASPQPFLRDPVPFFNSSTCVCPKNDLVSIFIRIGNTYFSFFVVKELLTTQCRSLKAVGFEANYAHFSFPICFVSCTVSLGFEGGKDCSHAPHRIRSPRKHPEVKHFEGCISSLTHKRFSFPVRSGCLCLRRLSLAPVPRLVSSVKLPSRAECAKRFRS